MKVLIVNKFLYPRGGAETYALAIGKGLREKGHEVQYFGMEDSRNTEGNSLCSGTSSMDFRSKGPQRFLYPFRIIYSWEARKKIQAVAKSFRPDIVHFNNINYHLTPSVIDGVWGLGIPMVQTVHDPQMVCPNHMLLDLQKAIPCERCIEGSKWNCAWRRCIHNSAVKSILGSIEGSLYKRTRHYSRVDLFLCPSRFMESILLRDRRFIGKTAVLHNAPGLEGGGKKEEKEDYVLYFGRLSKEKDLEGFLAACWLCPEIPFVIAGSGPLEHLMENLPPNVRYVGFQSGEALQGLIARARFSVYLSIWYENCPLSVLESQALGTPVLANRIGGIPELIEEGQTGVLVDTFTPESYAEQIRMLYSDRSRLDIMAENCRKKEMDSLESYCDKLVKIYSCVLERRQGE